LPTPGCSFRLGCIAADVRLRVVLKTILRRLRCHCRSQLRNLKKLTFQLWLKRHFPLPRVLRVPASYARRTAKSIKDRGEFRSFSGKLKRFQEFGAPRNRPLFLGRLAGKKCPWQMPPMEHPV
jgi:hypothetical protein